MMIDKLKKIQDKKIFIMTTGCERRALDVSSLMRYFQLNNCNITGDPRKADLIIFVTCSFKQSKKEKCFEYIDKFSKYKGELIIAGCLSEIAPIEFRDKFKGKFITSKNLKEIDELFDDFRVKFSDVSDSNVLNYRSASGFTHYWLLMMDFFKDFELSKKFYRRLLNDIRSITDSWFHLFPFYPIIKVWWKWKTIQLWSSCIINKIRFAVKKDLSASYLRISYGCIGNCTYCGIQRAVGTLKSKPLNVCLKEYRKSLEEGYRKFVIIADNVGAYGIDINSSFAELLEKLSEMDKDFNVQWSILELNPEWAIKYRAELLKRIKEKKIASILCAVQSGSERLLKLMDRYYNVEDVVMTLLDFRNKNPDLILASQFIVGFPSETDDDFFATLDLIKRIKFDYVSLFPYSDILGTPAYRMDNKIDDRTVKERLKVAAKFLDKERIILDCVN